LVNEFAKILDVDPWLFSCFHNVVESVDINSEADRHKLGKSADDLFKRIKEKYKAHQIDEKPYIFLKSDSGTYGMGILPIESSADILRLNRKDRNKLHVGKSGQVVQRYLLQEGVPTIFSIDQEISEVCIYQIENKLIGGFYRSHTSKGRRDNLNSPGMEFKKMCPHLSKYGDCGVHHDVNVFDLYRILARVAGIAAHREIINLEAGK
jgi:glutamate--cysteine ligase